MIMVARIGGTQAWGCIGAAGIAAPTHIGFDRSGKTLAYSIVLTTFGLLFYLWFPFMRLAFVLRDFAWNRKIAHVRTRLPNRCLDY